MSQARAENDRVVFHTVERSFVRAHRRVYSIVAGKRVRAGLWCSWCLVDGKPGELPIVQLGLLPVGLVVAEPRDMAPTCASRWGAIPLGTRIGRMFCSSRVGDLWPDELIGPSSPLIGCTYSPHLGVPSNVYSFRSILSIGPAWYGAVALMPWPASRHVRTFLVRPAVVVISSYPAYHLCRLPPIRSQD